MEEVKRERPLAVAPRPIASAIAELGKTPGFPSFWVKVTSFPSPKNYILSKNAFKSGALKRVKVSRFSYKTKGTKQGHKTVIIPATLLHDKGGLHA